MVARPIKIFFFAANGSSTADDVVWQTTAPVTVQKGDVYRFEAYVATLVTLGEHDGNTFVAPALVFQLGDGSNWQEIGASRNLDAAETKKWYQVLADGKFSESGNYYLRLINTQTGAIGNDFALDNMYFGVQSGAPTCSENCDSGESTVKEVNTGLMTASTQTVTTKTPSSVGTDSASVGVSVVFGSAITMNKVGICWSQNTDEPTLENNDGCESENYSNTASILFSVIAYAGELSVTASKQSSYQFDTTITGLDAGTSYYVRAFASNSLGTTYGDATNFTTTHPVSVPTMRIFF